MPEKEKIFRLDVNGPSPVVEITIGHAQRGSYWLYLSNPQSTDSEEIGHGYSHDRLSDRFEIKHAAKDLHGYALTWEGNVAVSSDDPGQSYSITVRISQGASEEEFLETGTFDKKTVPFLDYVRFII